jgi:hypothetical protein
VRFCHEQPFRHGKPGCFVYSFWYGDTNRVAHFKRDFDGHPYLGFIANEYSSTDRESVTNDYA